MTLKSVFLRGRMFLLCFSSIAAAQSAPATTQAAPPAQQSSPAVQPPPQAAEPPAKLILKEGTDVKLKFAQDLSSKTPAHNIPLPFILHQPLNAALVTA